MTEVERTVTQALEWLASEQDPEAIANHFGTGCQITVDGEPLEFTCSPCKAHGLPVLSFKLVNAYGEPSAHGLRELRDIPTNVEAYLKQAVEARAAVVSTWGGVEFRSFAIEVQPSKSVLRMCGTNYSDTRGPDCECKSAPVFCHGCPYRRERYERAKKPEGWW